MVDSELEQFKKEFDANLALLSNEELISQLEECGVNFDEDDDVLLFEEMAAYHQDDVANAVVRWLYSPHCGKRAFEKIKLCFKDIN